jgi:hypothetical protein
MPVIVVPWRNAEGRLMPCVAVCEALRAMLPGSPLVMADSGHEIFNRSASRNLGVNSAGQSDVVVVCDADTLPDPAGLASALTGAATGGLHYPFAVVNYLSELGTCSVLRGNQPDPADIEFSIPSAHGGCLVMRADQWRMAGGMDEQFEGWGYEDNAWHNAVATVLGAPTHHHGVAWHLWHPAERYAGTVAETRNWLRARKC